MKCPTCGAETVVLETRGAKRRRECFNEHRFTTEEVVVVSRQSTQRKHHEQQTQHLPPRLVGLQLARG